ncbi:MAG: hypothetical protein KBB95_27770 [Deltaproteobacteria bacterium]|nr:hypothetical protein [Deltaproteobacteria bacterium]
MRTAFLLALAMLLTSCFTATRTLRIASAGTTGCAPDDIEISNKRRRMGVRAWTATCSGQVYQCTYVGQGDANCTLQARPAALTEEPVSRPNPAGDQRRQEALLERLGPRFEFARSNGVLRGVRATFETRDAVMTFFFAPEVDRTGVQVIIVPRGNAALTSCVDVTFTGRTRALRAPLIDARATVPHTELIALTQDAPPPTARFCGGSWLLQRADVLGFARFGEHIAEALANAPLPSTGSTPTPPASGDTENVVRTRLNARSAALRACAGTNVVAVEASWDAQGELTLHVRGEDDSAVHACARSAVGNERVPTAQAGRLIHVIEAD